MHPAHQVNEKLLAQLKQRALARRERDFNDRRDEDWHPGGISDPGYRTKAMLTYAFDERTGHVYVGYSGGPGGMTFKGELANHQMAWRRYERIKDEIEEFRNDYPLEREPYNCGEAAAWAIAKSWGAHLDDLVFASFNLKCNLVPPCQNCQQWVRKYFS